MVFGAMQSPTMEIGSGDVIFKQATIRGFWGSVVSREMPAEQRRALFGELVQRIGDGSLTLPVDRVYSFDDVRDAAAANFEPGRSGKILLKP
ncbi:hypothetical protein [Nocardioides convexus]|uniref:hypothetical protein n=1 Tax=Nocardioides convexus TaxID=2712224 RepID=UPI0024183A9C|nr:hypothetical protein [Nocardioides convexus]